VRYISLNNLIFLVLSVPKDDIFIAGISKRWDVIFVKYLWIILTPGPRDAGKNARGIEHVFFLASADEEILHYFFSEVKSQRRLLKWHRG
jgi:hypothetical protein